MKYEMFIEQIKKSVEDYVGDAAVVSYGTVLKNNAVRLHGISIMPQGGNVSPTIYLEGYYAEYEKGKAISAIVADIIRKYDKNKLSLNVNIDFFADFEKVRKRVLCKLISYDKNEELLREVPHIRYLDLAIIFYCMVLHDEIGSATILIYNRHLAMWNVTVEDVYQAAGKNTRHLLGYQIKGMEEIMREMLVENLREELLQECAEAGVECPDEKDIAEFAMCMMHAADDAENGISMYVFSNLENLNGAACLLYHDILAEFAERLHQDLFIIPSSIHEVILVPTQEQDGYERLTQMVKEVNATQVEAEEILADHVYYYSRDKHEVMSM